MLVLCLLHLYPALEKIGSVHDFLIGCSLALVPPVTSFIWHIGEQHATTASHALLVLSFICSFPDICIFLQQ